MVYKLKTQEGRRFPFWPDFRGPLFGSCVAVNNIIPICFKRQKAGTKGSVNVTLKY